MPNFNHGLIKTIVEIRAWVSNHIQQKMMYRKISNIRRTESPNLDVSRLVVELSSPNPMKPGVKSRMKM